MRIFRVIAFVPCIMMGILVALRCSASEIDVDVQESRAPGVNVDAFGEFQDLELAGSAGALGDKLVTLSPFGEPEGLVIDPSGGFTAVRFDPPFEPPYVIQSIAFASHTANGVPAMFPSIRICGADPTGRPDLANPIFIQRPISGDANGTNSLPVALTVTEKERTFFVVLEFPTRGPTYPNDHPGLKVDQIDLERGYFSTTYSISSAGSVSVRDFSNAAVSMTFRLSNPRRVPIEAPTNLGANRVKDKVVFTFLSPGNSPAHGRTRRPNSLVGVEVLWARDFGPWRLLSTLGPEPSNFEIDSIPIGRSRWAVRAIDGFGNKSAVSNVEILDPYSRIFTGTSWGSEEPNGVREEAVPVALPIDLSDDASIFPSRDRDFYSFDVLPGDEVHIWASPSGPQLPNRDTLDLAAALYDGAGRLVALDDNSLGGKSPKMTYRVPPSPARGFEGVAIRLTVEFFDIRGSEFAPLTRSRPSSNRAYWYHIDTGSVVASSAPGTLGSSKSSRSELSVAVRGALGKETGVVEFSVELGSRAGGHGSGTLRIFDVQGRLRKSLAMDYGIGRQVLSWDGRGENGASLPAGVYFAAFEDGPERLCRKFVVAK